MIYTRVAVIVSVGLNFAIAQLWRKVRPVYIETPWDPKILTVVDTWLLFGGQFCINNQIWNIKMMVAIGKWLTLFWRETFSDINIDVKRKIIQAALTICGLFIYKFEYLRLKNGLFSGTYPLIYSDWWSFYMQIHYIRAYFWSPYLWHITRFTCALTQFFRKLFRLKIK